MSDDSVIEKFIGKDGKQNKYEQRDEDKIENNHPEKAPYYPRLGVKLMLEKHLLTDVPGGAYVKIVVEGTWSARLAVERAVFRVVGDTLVAKDIEVNSGLLLTETLTMKVNAKGHKEMEHSLTYSDGKHGKWICEP